MLPEDAVNVKLSQSLPISSTIQRRPWPSRKISEAEEMVKYMSSIPRYLQREDNQYNIQEKALNVGVLDWGQLQKWTDTEKPFANKISHDSNSPSLSLAFDSSPRHFTSPRTERKQSSTFEGQRFCKSSGTADPRSLSAEKDVSKEMIQDSSKHILKSQTAEVDFDSLPSAGSEKFALLRRNANTNIAKLEEIETSVEKDGDRPKQQSRRKHLEEIIARSMSSFDTSLLDPQTKMYRRTSLPPLSSGPFEVKGNTSSLPIFLPRADLKGTSVTPLKSIADIPNEAVATGKSRSRASPMRLFLDQPRKSVSSSATSASNIPDVVNCANRRGRRSPVRQMLDPVLNSSSAPDAPSSDSTSNSRGRRSPLRQMFEPPRKSSSSINSSHQQPHEPRGILVEPPTGNENSSSDSNNSPLTRQALLKLSWKNGLPLLMFSSSDDRILVATMHKRGDSDMNFCDASYEIHTAMAVEVKKKNGAWLGQGTKSKKPEFACNFVAELIHTNCSSIRQLFVLLGDEFAPTNLVDAKSMSSSELAAIVVESPQQMYPYSCGAVCIPQIVAILPSDVHGLSNTKEPSKLIERWESGGSCDCGGWDQGCALTVLSNKSQGMTNSKSGEDCGAIDGTSCGFDLFAEGDAKRGKHSFRMVAFKKDMFTVEFKSSIHLLQAFAISIAMLHDRNPGDCVMENHSFDSIDYGDYLSFDSYPSMTS